MANHSTATLLFFSTLTFCCSGTLVGFSYDARSNSSLASLTETVNFLRKNQVPHYHIRVYVSDPKVLESLCSSGLSLDLYVTGNKIENLRKTNSWIKNRIFELPCFNITSITVSSQNELNDLTLLLPALNSIHSTLVNHKLEHKLKLSAAFSLSFLENLLPVHPVSQTNHVKDLQQTVDFIRKSKSSIVIETDINGDLSLGDRLIRLMIEAASSATTVLPYNDLPLILNFKSSAVPSATEILEFSKKLKKLIRNQIKIKSRISGFFAEISPLPEFEKKEMDREEEQIFPSSHRELFNKNSQPFFPTKTSQHDLFTTPPPPTVTVYPTTDPITIPPTPITNPVINPVTTPVANPTPPPTFPVTDPVTPPVPVTNPITTPITTPTINPVPTPGTTPITTPVTTPITTPITSPTTAPVTTPITTAPPAVPATTPVTVTPPAATIPGTTSPTVLGQSWCIAKTGAVESSLQIALDYACGIGGADCGPIQQTGACYNPNTLRDHASYAFNSYYQKNPVSSSCEFGGTAMIANTNPSSGSCTYPSSSASSSSSVLNTSNPAESTIFGSAPPSASHAVPLLVSFPLLFISLMVWITAKQP